MTKLTTLFVLGCLTAALGCASFGADFVTPEIQVLGLESLERTGVEQRVRVDLRLRNPNNFPIAFEGMTFQLKVNDEVVGQAISSETIALPRLGETSSSLVVSTTLLQVARGAMAMIDQGGEIAFELDGRLFMRDPDRRAVPFTHQGGFDGFFAQEPDHGEDGLVPF